MARAATNSSTADVHYAKATRMMLRQVKMHEQQAMRTGRWGGVVEIAIILFAGDAAHVRSHD
jgi:hypothetical protein